MRNQEYAYDDPPGPGVCYELISICKRVFQTMSCDSLHESEFMQVLPNDGNKPLLINKCYKLIKREDDST